MKKRVPRFWWDYKWKNNKIFSIIVESNEPQYPVLAEFIIYNKNAMPQMEKADKIIDDLESGRLTLKQALKNHIK